MILDDEVFAVLLAIIVVGSVFAAAQVIPRHTEPFTAIGLLNAEGKIGDYPRTILVGEPVKLNIFLDNHLGRAALLQVRMKLGGRDHLPSPNESLDSPVILNRTVVLEDGGNTTIPVVFRLGEPGRNVALVFELWGYNTTTHRWEYTGRWVHLYVNVTAPVKTP